MDDVRDHEQVQEDQCERAPPAGLRFTYAGFTVAREGDRGTGSSRNRSSSFQFLADATTFHRVGEFTSKRAVRYRANGVAIARAANSQTIAIEFRQIFFTLPIRSWQILRFHFARFPNPRIIQTKKHNVKDRTHCFSASIALAFWLARRGLLERSQCCKDKSRQ